MPTPEKFSDLTQVTPTDSDLIVALQGGVNVIESVSDILNTPLGQVVANPVDSQLLNFRFDPYNLNQNGYNAGKYQGAQFGNVVWDADNSVFRMFFGDGVDSVRVMTSNSVTPSPKSFFNVGLALGPGGSLDAKLDVPFVWYEASEVAGRPWRMIYRGSPTSGGTSQIFLATAVQNLSGAPVWERKDTQGNVLTTPVIASGVVGSWDQGSIDFGGVIKVGDTYYIYYDTIYVAQRLTGVASSKDLVTWVKYGRTSTDPTKVGYSGSALFSGVVNVDSSTQGPDKNYAGTTDLKQGFFCGDIVYWPREDGSSRFVHIVPHYSGVNTLPSYDVFVSDNVVMTKANRTYIGKLFKTNTNDKYLSGMLVDSSGCDTPRIITDDITRNVATSTITGNDVVLIGSVRAGVDNFVMVPFIWDKTLNGSSTVNVVSDIPSAAPVYKLANGSTHTKALWYPSLTGDTRDISGNGYNLGGQITGINATNGAQFTAAKTEFSSYGKTTGTILDTALKAITTTFSIEMAITLASAFTSGTRTPWCYDGGTGLHHFLLWLSPLGSNSYRINLGVTSGGATHNVNSSPITLLADGTKYRIAITCDHTNIYFYLNGSLINSTAFAYTIDTLNNVPIFLGSDNTAGYWDGTVDEIRISDNCITPANTPPVLTYQTTGYIYTPVQDWGANNKVGVCEVLNQVLPTGCAITVLYRNAKTSTDKSVNLSDFSATPSLGRYAQFCIVLTGTGALTPSFDSVNMYGEDPGILFKVPYTGATADMDLGTHNAIAANLIREVTFTFQNGGSALVAGLADIAPALAKGGTLVGVYLTAPDGVTGNVAIDIFRRNAAVPASNTYSIINPSGSGSGSYPALSGASYLKDVTFTNWNSIVFADNDVIQVAVNASPTPTVNYLTVTLLIK